MLSDQPYRYLTVDEMKSLGDDSLPIDVTRDERMDSNRECMAPPTAVDDTISPQHAKENYSQFTTVNYTPDNIDINCHPVHVGFLVSFLVDARGGAMRGCRHSGVRVIVPPRKASMPMRVTCRYLKRDKLSHPPPLMEGEALASRILELGPVGAKFLGPVIIEVPHFGSLRGMEREIVILRSDNGETWREHTLEASEEAVHDVLNESFEGEELTALEEMSSGRMTRILTTDFPQYFAVVSRIRQEVHAIGPEGGMVSSSVVPQVQAVFPQGALTKKIKVGLQAQPIAAELAAKLLGNRVAVSPIVTVEPRRRKFHKPITLTIPVPQAANKGMINQYSGDAPTLRLLCSITGGTTRAQWEDVTGSTPLTFVNDCVSFTTTVSARFWLMDCRNIGEATKMATELYKEAIHVPFMAKFVVFAKRVDILEARLRVFCMTDDKEDKTLEHQEHFTEVAKSRDVEVLEGKSQYIEFAGNLVPVTKSGDQLQLGFRAFRENRLPFTVRVKDPHADTVGRILFMREPKVAKGEPPQQPICILNIVLPETILPETTVSEPDLLVLHKKYSFLRDGGLGRYDTTYQRTDLRLSDISNLLGEDWVPLANELGITTSKVNLIKSECPTSVAQQAMAMLRLWLQQSGNKATGNVLETALRKIGRDDIVQQCIFNVDEMDRAVEKVQLDQSGFDSLKEELGPSRDASLRRDASLDITYDEQDIMKESESVEELVQAEKKEPLKDKAGKEPDVDETKYIGEEKVVEEERKTVAQLKEIFAQDKRDRQYERQPPVSEQQEIITEKKEEITKIMPQEPKDILTSKAVTTETRTITVTKVEKDISKPPPITPSTKRTEEVPTVPVRTDADQRRDSELFQGVSEGLVRLETTYKVIPGQPEIMSPKVSKTPPPSPAEFKDMTGTTITTTTATTMGGTTTVTTTKTTTIWQQAEAPPPVEQQSPMQEWTEKEQPTDKEPRTTKSGKSASVGTQEQTSDTKLSPASETSQVENLKSPAVSIKVEERAQTHAKSSVEEPKEKTKTTTNAGKDNDQATGRAEKGKETAEDKIGKRDAIPVIEVISENQRKLTIEELGDKTDTVRDNQKPPTPGKDLTGGKIAEEPLAKQVVDQIKKQTDEIIITEPLTSKAREMFEQQSSKYPEKLPKIKEFQSETKPIVTTPTLSRRGLGGSQRLSRDQRPPPLDVSHMIISDEGTDEDMGSAGYIVTEPSEEKPDKNKKSEIYRINSSPDILTDPKVLPPKYKDDEEKVESKTAEKDVPESVKSDIPKPFIPIEEVLETPVSDTAAELEASSPILFSVEQQPMFHDKFEYSGGQTMEDIEALIEKANRDLAKELEMAGICLTDAGDESAEEDVEKHEEKAEPFQKEYDLSAAVGEEIIQKPKSDKTERKEMTESEKEEKKLRRVERRFERMASETLEKEAKIEGSTAPEMERKREAEFERMVSQLSYEEVTDCQKEYMQLLDEGGLTPSEDWDSRDPDTPSGELDDESAPAAASPTGTVAMSDWEQEKAAVSRDAPDVGEEGEGSGVRRSVEQTTDTRVVEDGTVTRTVTTTTTTVHGDSGSVQKLEEAGKPSPKKSE